MWLPYRRWNQLEVRTILFFGRCHFIKWIHSTSRFWILGFKFFSFQLNISSNIMFTTSNKIQWYIRGILSITAPLPPHTHIHTHTLLLTAWPVSFCISFKPHMDVFVIDVDILCLFFNNSMGFCSKHCDLIASYLLFLPTCNPPVSGSQSVSVWWPQDCP